MRQALSSAILSLTVLTTAGAIALPMTAPAIAQEASVRVLTVTGQGNERITTTRATVSLGVEAQGTTAQAAQVEAARRSTAVVELLRDRGVDQLQTTGIQLNPQYRYDNGQSELVGYMASNTVSFEVPVETVGPLLDEAVAAGATQIQGVSFKASDAAIAEARAVALRQAVADAQAQASAVLGALDLGPQEIVGIQINGANHPPVPVPIYRAAQLAEATADVSTPVVGGEQTVTATVTLQIRY